MFQLRTSYPQTVKLLTWKTTNCQSTNFQKCQLSKPRTQLRKFSNRELLTTNCRAPKFAIRNAPLINISSSNRRQMALMYKGVEIYGIEKRQDF